MRQVDGTEGLARVRALRQCSTEAEALLWARLRARRFEGLKFRRQAWIGPFIADFLCKEAMLVVEVDGSQHGASLAYDAARSRFLGERGFKVLRFWNNQVLNDLEGVLAAVRAEIVPSPSHPALPDGPRPLPGRERGL